MLRQKTEMRADVLGAVNNTLDTFLGHLKVTDHIKRAIGLQIGKRVIEEDDAAINGTTFGDQMRASMVKALQTSIDSRVEEKVIQGITATGVEGTVKTAVKEAAIAQRVDTEVANAVSAHVKGTVSSAVAKAGIEDKVGAAVNDWIACLCGHGSSLCRVSASPNSRHECSGGVRYSGEGGGRSR